MIFSFFDEKQKGERKKNEIRFTKYEEKRSKGARQKN